jgi:hypothetical protein
VTKFPGEDVTWPAEWRFHISEGKYGILLECRKWGSEIPDSVQCSVEDPQGQLHYARLRWTVGSARCVYPVDFDVVPESGGHHVHWTAMGRDIGFKTDKQEAMYEVLDFAIRVQSTHTGSV